MNRILRIAMLSVHSSPLGPLGTADTGGMSVYLLELSSELGKRGHRVDIFTRQTKKNSVQITEFAPNVRIISLAVPGTQELFRAGLFDHLPRFCREIDRFTKQTGISYDLIHSNYWLSGVVGDQLKALWACPHVITFHTLAAVKMAVLQAHVEDQRRVAEETRLLHCCDGVIVPTAEEGRILASMCRGEKAAVYHIPWGVNLDHFTPADPAAERLSIAGADAHPLALFVGRFDPMKGIESAIKSLPHLKDTPELHLALIGGDGPASVPYQQVAQLVKSLGIGDRVHLLGAIEHSQMARYYQKADIVVVSSHYESFGLVILEALACGTPVASTPVGIAPLVIVPGLNGCLAAAGDDRSLVEAMYGALTLAASHEPGKISQSVRGYSWTKVAAFVLDAYYDTVRVM
jgi:D-inositol-3-phosphate glycosyltransferase